MNTEMLLGETKKRRSKPYNNQDHIVGSGITKPLHSNTKKSDDSLY